MAKQVILGTDTVKVAFEKCNANYEELYAELNVFPSVLSDGNTVGWYDFENVLHTDNKVSQFTDLSGLNHHIPQSDPTAQPTLTETGVLFDGVTDWMESEFEWNQPNFIYIVFKQISYTVGDNIFQGHTLNKNTLIQLSVSPELYLYSDGVNVLVTGQVAINTYCIAKCLFNGANSMLQINENAPITGVLATTPMNGIILGTDKIRTGFGNIEISHLIIRKVADTETDQSAIYNYLKKKASL